MRHATASTGVADCCSHVLESYLPLSRSQVNSPLNSFLHLSALLMRGSCICFTHRLHSLYIAEHTYKEIHLYWRNIRRAQKRRANLPIGTSSLLVLVMGTPPGTTQPSYSVFKTNANFVPLYAAPSSSLIASCCELRVQSVKSSGFRIFSFFTKFYSFNLHCKSR